MTTNKTKHRMLSEAKKIANKFYIDKQIVEFPEKNSGEVDFKTIRFYSKEQQKEDDILNILDNHPEFDEDRFRDMIETFTKSKREPINDS